MQQSLGKVLVLAVALVGLLVWVIVRSDASALGTVASETQAAVVERGRESAQPGPARRGGTALAAGPTQGGGSRTTVEPSNAAELVVVICDQDKVPLPDAVVAAVTDDDQLVATYPADEFGRVALPMSADAQRWVWLAAAPGFDPLSMFLEYSGESDTEPTIMRLYRGREVFLTTWVPSGRSLDPGWKFGYDFGALLPACFDWIPDGPVMYPAGEWTRFTQFETYYDNPLFVLQAPDGCLVFDASFEFWWPDEEPRLGLVAPSGLEEADDAIVVHVPMHLDHAVGRLSFLDEANRPMADAEVVFKFYGDVLMTRTLDARGEVLMNLSLGDSLDENDDLTGIVKRAGAPDWQVNVSTAALREAGVLVFRLAKTRFDWQLNGERPEEFEVAVAREHGAGLESGEAMGPSMARLHVASEGLTWVASSPAGSLQVEVSRGLDEFCGLVRHQASGFAVAGVCGILPGVVHTEAVPAIGTLRVEPSAPLETPWALQLQPNRSESGNADGSGWRQETSGLVLLDADRLQRELPYGAYSVTLHRGGKEFELPPIKLDQPEVVLPLSLDAIRTVKGRMFDSFGVPQDYTTLMVEAGSLGSQEVRTDRKGQFQFVMPSEATPSDVRLLSPARSGSQVTPLRSSWLPDGTVEVELATGRVHFEVDAPNIPTGRIPALLRPASGGRKVWLDLRHRKSPLVLQPGDYTLDLRTDQSATPGDLSMSFSVVAGAETHLVVDCGELTRLSLTLRSSVEGVVDAFLASDPAIDTNQAGAVPLMTFDFWSGAVEQEECLMAPGTYDLLLRCAVEQGLDPRVEFTFEHTVTLEGVTNIELDLDEHFVAELRRLLPSRPELRALLDELE